MTDQARARFDQAVIDRCNATHEVDIETVRRAGRPRRTTIWIVTDGSDVYVRSVRGSQGHWYRELTATQHGVLHIGSDRFAVRARRADDPETIDLVGDLFRAKYGPASRSTQAMLQPKTLETTLRLEPRAS
jgi:hypothetical protein